VDYATPTATPVDWTASTIGENSTSDGVVSPGEASLRTGALQGVFNDFIIPEMQSYPKLFEDIVICH